MDNKQKVTPIYTTIQAFSEDAEQIAHWAIDDKTAMREVVARMVAAECERRAAAQGETNEGTNILDAPKQ